MKATTGITETTSGAHGTTLAEKSRPPALSVLATEALVRRVARLYPEGHERRERWTAKNLTPIVEALQDALAEAGIVLRTEPIYCFRCREEQQDEAAAHAAVCERLAAHIAAAKSRLAAAPASLFDEETDDTGGEKEDPLCSD